MSKQYIPKVADTVFMAGRAFVRYVVTKVAETKKTADVKTTPGTVILYRDAAWPNIYELDGARTLSGS